MMHTITDKDLDFVKRVAGYVRGKHAPTTPLEDLVAAGNLGLVKAAKRYNETNNASFHSYATHRVKGEMLDYIRTASHGSRTMALQIAMEPLEDDSAVTQPVNDIWIDIERTDLTNKERRTMLRHLAGDTFQLIGNHEGVTESAICQRYTKAIKKIRSNLEVVAA